MIVSERSERSQVLVCVCVCVCVIRYHLSDTRISSFQTKNNIDDVAKREKFTPIPRITMHHCVKTHPPMHNDIYIYCCHPMYHINIYIYIPRSDPTHHASIHHGHPSPLPSSSSSPPDDPDDDSHSSSSSSSSSSFPPLPRLVSPRSFLHSNRMQNTDQRVGIWLNLLLSTLPFALAFAAAAAAAAAIPLGFFPPPPPPFPRFLAAAAKGITGTKSSSSSCC